MKTEDAVGHILCHDITQIIRGVTKDPVFRKGHIITKEDIPVLLSVGKDHVYIWENDDTVFHENEGAAILRDICMGAHMHGSEPKEGKIELIADCDGVLTVRRQALQAVNSVGEMMIATRHGGFTVRKGDKLAGTRVIPLIIKKEKMARAKEAAGPLPLLDVHPFKKKRAGVVTTGNEVFHGRIEDTFTPVIECKLAEFDAEMAMHKVLADDPAAITAAIQEMLDAGMDMVFCTGGMSVDPDDQTPLAIKNTGPASYPTEPRFCRGPCFYWPIRKTTAPSSAFRAASCIPSGRFLISSCRRSWPMFRSRPPICPVSAKADCVSTVLSAPSRTVVLESRCSCEPIYTY